MLVPSRVFRPSIEPLAPASSSPRGSCCATPSPQLTSPGGHDQGRFARPASFLQARRKWGYREPPGKNVESLGQPPHTQGLPHLQGCGARSPARLPRSPAAAHPACLRARSKVEREVPWRRSPDPLGRGHRALLPQDSGAARSPLCNSAGDGDGGGLGRFPPTLALESGAEAPAARVSCLGGHGTALSPGQGSLPPVATSRPAPSDRKSVV